MEEVYRPKEDSYLLQRWVEKLVCGCVLDMGTGSGIQSVTAALNPCVTHVLAVDINPAALVESEKRAYSAGVVSKIEYKLSDLFSSIEGVFDWVLFNTPYLPSESEYNEASWAGGETGGEIIRRFLADVKEHLSSTGCVLMIYSSQSGLNNSDFTEYKFEMLEEMGLFFEKIYCVKLNPS